MQGLPTLDPVARQPFGAPPPQEGGFDWRDLAAGAAGLGGLAAIIGSAKFGPAQARLYRDWVRKVATQGGPAVENAPGGEWVKRLLGGSWWHGTSATPEKILQEGFSPAKAVMGVRFGEPSGVSMSAHPDMAMSFSSDARPLRVWPNVDPKSVLPIWSQEAADPLLKAYLAALETPFQGKSIRDYLRSLNTGGWGVPYAVREMPSNYPQATGAFNTALGKEMEKQGIQGLLYSPHRYNEYELRVFDPKRVIPMEVRSYGDVPTGLDWEAREGWLQRNDPYVRFKTLKERKVIEDYRRQIPLQENKSLSDFYKKIPEEKIFGTSMPPKHDVEWKDLSPVDALYAKPVHSAYQELKSQPGLDWAKQMKIPEAAHAVVIANPPSALHPATSDSYWDKISKLLHKHGDHEAADFIDDFKTKDLYEMFFDIKF